MRAVSITLYFQNQPLPEAASGTPVTWHRAESARTCKLLLAGRARLRVLAEFTGRENTTVQAAATLDRPPGALYRLGEAPRGAR